MVESCMCAKARGFDFSPCLSSELVNTSDSALVVQAMTPRFDSGPCSAPHLATTLSLLMTLTSCGVLYNTTSMPCIIVAYGHVPYIEVDNKSAHSVPGTNIQHCHTAYHPAHHPMHKNYAVMDLPDDTSATSSSPENKVSVVSETLSSVALSHLKKKPKGITDLPYEMSLRIYRYLDSSYEIAALNSTSRMCYWIWRMNTVSISSAVLSRSIDCYNSALELFEVKERVKQIHCIITSRCTALKRVRVAQKEAREIVEQGRRTNLLDHISSDALYRGILYRNGRLLSAAKDASHLLGLIENKVVYSGGTSPGGFDRLAAPSSQDVIIAYHELMILMRLRYLEAIDDRLEIMCKRKIRNMLYVATYLVCDCPDKDKILLGISRTIILPVIPGGWMTDDWDLGFRPRCKIIVPARRAFCAVADAVGEARIPDHVFENQSGCHGDCGEFGKIG